MSEVCKIKASLHSNVGDEYFSVNLFYDNRIQVTRGIGSDYTMLSFCGDESDFVQFDERHPKEWFHVGVKIIEKRGK